MKTEIELRRATGRPGYATITFPTNASPDAVLREIAELLVGEPKPVKTRRAE